jgi:hypothetical protein
VRTTWTRRAHHLDDKQQPSVWEEAATSPNTLITHHIADLRRYGGATSQEVGCPSWECATSQKVRTLLLAHAQTRIIHAHFIPLTNENHPFAATYLFEALFVSNMSPHVSLIFALFWFSWFYFDFFGFFEQKWFLSD